MRTSVTGVVLAGGLGRRMSVDGQGIDKAWVRFRDRPLIDHVIERLAPQVDRMLINGVAPGTGQLSNGPSDTITWIPDQMPGRLGPLAGLHAAMSASLTEWIVSAPCDAPFVPRDLVVRLTGALEASPGASIAVALADRRLQPVFVLAHRQLRLSIQAYLDAGGRAVEPWLAQHHPAVAPFDDPRGFVNLNTPEQLRQHDLA